MSERVLIVEDEASIADVVEFALKRSGFATSVATTLVAARSQLQLEAPDLVVLDLGLPDGDGLDLCRELSVRSRVPVVVLTCRDEELDRVLGLESGADDYVVKPFSPRELVARVRAVLRRTRGASGPLQEVLHCGRISLSPAEHRVRLDGTEIALTPTEFRLLRTLMEATERVFSRRTLAERVYHEHCFISERTVDSHIKGIRRKFAAVDSDADPIETVFGVGYRARRVP
jgi:DNA-binding response OmpR family regulator